MEKYKFYQNRECEYFPCHKGADIETFNCLFCYCPLYALKDKCGGNFAYLESGIKSCMGCTKTHGAGGYDYVMSRMKDVMNLGRREEDTKEKIPGNESLS